MTTPEPTPEEPAPEKPWVGPEEWKRQITEKAATMATWVSLIDILFEALKLGFVMTAIVWVVAERTPAAMYFWLLVAVGVVMWAWFSMKVIPHIIRLCKIETVTTRDEATKKFIKIGSIGIVIAAWATLVFVMGLSVGVDQLVKL